jgi:peroxiredoxin
MALTYSTMLPLDTLAPDFTLPDVCSGEKISLHTLKPYVGTVIMFICNHCPYVKHILSGVIETARKYQAKNIQFIAINSNDIENYAEDSPESMKNVANQLSFPFPYLFDETQEVAKAYNAACTPEFYLFDETLRCVYRGRFDDSSPGNQHPVTGKDLSQAIDNLLAHKPIDAEQFPSMGCNIKWKK